MIDLDFLPQLEQIPVVKPSINIGALLDIPTGKYYKGIHGEYILNGGLGILTGVVGIANNFKSAVADYMVLSASKCFDKSRIGWYDTELNMQESRKHQISQGIYEYKGRNLLSEGRVTITDKSQLFANDWYEKKREFFKVKESNAKKITVSSPFVDRDGKSLMTMLYPTFDIIDSFTEFETEDVANMQSNNELGDSGANTIFMKQGQSKTRFIQDLPKLITRANNPMVLTGHIGKTIPMDPRAAPVKKLQYLKNGDVIKGVTDKFLFLTTNCWQCQNAAPFLNDGTKSSEYPRDSSDNLKGDTDLNIVTLSLLRNKNGPSGLMIQVLVSQQEGVHGPLSEFHYCKVNDRFGIDGTLQHYSLDLMPDVKLSRTTVRGKLDSDPKLRRAMNITSEMLQMRQLWDDVPEDVMCTPKQLYEDIKKLGYDWDVLLNTRGWWTCDNDKHPIPYLSTMDLLQMRVGNYKPYWLK